MSQEEIQAIHTILQNILSPDNTIRGDAEKQLNQLKSNSAGLVFCLSKILIETTISGVKTLACVLLRKILHIKEEDAVNPIWTGLESSAKEEIKSNLLKAIIQEQNKTMKIKLCDTMATVAENVFESKEPWVDFFNFIYQGISLSPEAAENIPNIETVLFLLSQIFGYVYDELVPKLDSFITTFNLFFKTESFELKTRTSQVIGEILTIVGKKDSKKFKTFIPLILEHTMKCLMNPKEEQNVRLLFYI